jgi:hypothetical protein
MTTDTKVDDTSVYVYAHGLVHVSACAPVAMTHDQVAAAVNSQHPTGISSSWVVSDEPFADGTPNPVPCDQDPDGRRHYLLYC